MPTGDYQSPTKIELFEMEVKKETPKGFWIMDVRYRKRWIHKDALVTYAYEDLDNAWMDYVRRLYARRMFVQEATVFVDHALNHAKQLSNIKQHKSVPITKIDI